MTKKLIEDQGVPMVLFSGGLDSTYLLLDTLKRYKHADILICSLAGQDYVNIRGRRVADIIISKIKALSLKKPNVYGAIRHINYQTVPGYNYGATSLTQPIGWLTAAFYNLRIDTSALLYAIVEGDSTLPSISNIKHLWQSIQTTGDAQCFNGGNVELLVPLIYKNKTDYVWEKEWSSILRNTTWCENLKSIRNDCGECESCKRMVRDFSFVKLTQPTEWEKYPLKNRVNRLIEKNIK